MRRSSIATRCGRSRGSSGPVRVWGRRFGVCVDRSLWGVSKAFNARSRRAFECLPTPNGAKPYTHIHRTAGRPRDHHAVRARPGRAAGAGCRGQSFFASTPSSRPRLAYPKRCAARAVLLTPQTRLDRDPKGAARALPGHAAGRRRVRAPEPAVGAVFFGGSRGGVRKNRRVGSVGCMFCARAREIAAHA